MSRYIIYILLVFIAFTSCKRVVVKVDKIPANTPAGQQLYITGNFNNWDPGEELYILRMDKDSNYYFTLPPGFGTIEYKFTRGDWTTVEKGLCHEEIDNRKVEVDNIDTVTDQILSWNDKQAIDCNQITFRIKDLPENTPQNEGIYLIGSLNSWTKDDRFEFTIDEAGHYSLTVEKPGSQRSFDYKISRGGLDRSESDIFGNDVENRKAQFGVDQNIEISVSGWTDIPDDKSKYVIFIIDELPYNTPGNQSIYMSCNINSWTQKDQKYQFRKNEDGQYYLPVKRENANMEYKILRGYWNSVEVNENGWDIDNRQTDLATADTVFLKIAQWKDIIP